MDPLLIAARRLLAVVFGGAGAAERADRAGTRRALGAFGVPARLVPAGSWAFTLGSAGPEPIRCPEPLGPCSPATT